MDGHTLEIKASSLDVSIARLTIRSTGPTSHTIELDGRPLDKVTSLTLVMRPMQLPLITMQFLAAQEQS